MKIQYVFSRNKKCGSRLIAWASSLFSTHIPNLKNGIPSHVAVLLDEKLVVEAVLTSGIRIVPFKKWSSFNEELYRIDRTKKAECINCLLNEMWGKKYDWLGIIYFAYSIIKYLIFKSELPNVNKWERENYFFCTEFAARLDGYNYSMTTPAKMCNDLLESVK